MSKTNQQGRFGAYYCCASSSIILRTEIATWLVRIQIKIKPPYNLKDLGDKVVLFYVASICNSSPFTFVKRNIFLFDVV